MSATATPEVPLRAASGRSSVATMNERVAVVVDGYSTGALYAPAFTAFGIGAVHVANGAEHSDALLGTFVPGTYRACYRFDGDMAALVGELGRHQVRWVVAGTESGVELADRLAEALGLSRNNRAATASARRDKLAMQDALTAAGVPAGWHVAARTPEEARAAVQAHGGGTSVVKPLRSAGTDGVRVADDADAAASAAAELLRTRTIYGQGNETVLVQQYLEGDEYMVNCLSVDGKHTPTEIWRSVKTKVGDAPVYDYTELVGTDDEQARTVARYVYAVLDALGTRWGPSHTEVILTAEGPLLVESAARPQGTIDVSAVTRATGRNPIVEAVHAVIDPDRYAAGPVAEPVRRAARGVSFICPATGRLRRDLDWERVRALPSFHSLLAQSGRAGEFVTRTCDLFNRPGAVYLVHDDPAVVAGDHAAIRSWEADGFYDIEPVRT